MPVVKFNDGTEKRFDKVYTKTTGWIACSWKEDGELHRRHFPTRRVAEIVEGECTAGSSVIHGQRGNR